MTRKTVGAARENARGVRRGDARRRDDGGREARWRESSTRATSISCSLASSFVWTRIERTETREEAMAEAMAEEARAPATGDAKDEESDARSTRTVTLKLKITHATANVPSMSHLMEHHEVEVNADGSDTAADVKRKLSVKAGVPAHALCLKWFDRIIGRCNEDDDIELDEKATLKQFNVIPWIEKFPHWYATLSFLDPPEPDTYESIHTAVAIHKNIPDVKGYVDGLRGTPDWFELQK